MKVINMFGGPGSGKTTTALGLAYKMKLAGISVDIVNEYARELIYEGRHDVLEQRQEDIFTEQERRLHRLRFHLDWVIVDSPLLLSLVYGDHMPQPFKDFVVHKFNTYDNINIWLERPSVYQVGDPGRREDEAGARRKDREIMNVLEQYGGMYRYYKTSDSVVDVLYNDLVNS